MLSGTFYIYPLRLLKDTTRPDQKMLAGKIQINKETFSLKISYMKDDGSIKKNRGKIYVYCDINATSKVRVRGKNRLQCPKCQTLAGPLFNSLLSLMEQKFGKKVAPWFGGWSVFTFWEAVEIPNTVRTHSTRRCGPEAVHIRYAMKANCPVHGNVTAYDEDVAD